MTLPEFPDSREILLDDKPLFDAALAERPPELSAYTFTNIFAWREPYGASVSQLGGQIVVHHERDRGRFCLEPIGKGDVRATMEAAWGRSDPGTLQFERVQSATADLFRDDPAFEVSLDRDDSDYLHASSDLIELPGRKYDAKRNFIKRFQSSYDYEYVVLTGETAAECHDFADQWCEERSCQTVEGLRREQCAVYQMLTNFDALGIRGGAIRVSGAIVAFSLGEALNPETLVVHVEKADSQYEGLYQVINNEFCSREARHFAWVNREQDLGVPGLRKAKESYHPVRMVEAYRIRLRGPV